MAKKEPAQNNQQLIIGAVAVGIALLVGVRTCRKSAREPIPPPAAVSKNAEKPADAPSNQPSLLDSPQFAKNNEKEILAKRLKAGRLDDLGIKTLPLKVGKNGLELHVEFTPRPVWCQGGDLDVMKRVIDDTKATTILITIENPDHTLAADPRRVSLLQLFTPTRISFNLKKVDLKTKGELNLYICSDRTKTNKCGNKPPVATNQQGEYSRKADYNFYFQQFFIGDGKLTSYKSGEFTDNYKKGLTNYLNEQHLPSDVDKAWKIARALRSDPVAVKNERIYVYLSHNDPKCTFDM